MGLPDLKVEVQRHPSIEEIHTFMIQNQNGWMNPILSFLQDGCLPIGANEVRKVKKRGARFIILNDTLYKKGFSMPYLRCVEKDEAKYIIEEVHEGIYRDHTGLRSLVSKIIRTCYYWPTMQKDAKEYVEKCDKCQRFGKVQRVLREKMTAITSL